MWMIVAGLVVLLVCTLAITETAGITNLATILGLRARGRVAIDEGPQFENHRVVEIPARLEVAAESSTPDASTAADLNDQRPLSLREVDPERTVADLQKAVDLGELQVAARPDDPESQSRLATALTDLALSFRSQKRLGEARPLLERAVRLHAAVWKEHPERDDFRNFLAVEFSTLAETLLQLGNYTDTARIAEELPRTFPGDWQVCHQGARFLLGCVGLVTRDEQMSQADRTALGRSYLHSARRLLQEAVGRGSSAVAGALEAENLEILAFQECTPWPQMMSAWGLERWSNGFQLWCPAQQHGFVVVEIAITNSGRYRLGVYLTKGPDCGIVELSLDDIPIGELFDGFAPAVIPSGKVDFGDVHLIAGKHRLRFQTVNRNPESAGYSFGIDCLVVTPATE
jgi:tetratricopeptide (TPR) repeat protein